MANETMHRVAYIAASLARDVPACLPHIAASFATDAARIGKRNHRHAERRCDERGYDGDDDDTKTPAARCERSMKRAIEKAGMVLLADDPRNAARGTTPAGLPPGKVGAYPQGDPRGPGIVLAWMDVSGVTRTACL